MNHQDFTQSDSNVLQGRLTVTLDMEQQVWSAVRNSLCKTKISYTILLLHIWTGNTGYLAVQ